MSMYSARLGKLPPHLTDNVGDTFTMLLVQHQLERSMLATIFGSAIVGIDGCTVVHRLEPYGGVLFQASRSCGLLGRKLDSTLENFGLGTSFPGVVVTCCWYHL
jgi:hypothetical protein